MFLATIFYHSLLFWVTQPLVKNLYIEKEIELDITFFGVHVFSKTDRGLSVSKGNRNIIVCINKGIKPRLNYSWVQKKYIY